MHAHLRQQHLQILVVRRLDVTEPSPRADLFEVVEEVLRAADRDDDLSRLDALQPLDILQQLPVGGLLALCRERLGFHADQVAHVLIAQFVVLRDALERGEVVHGVEEAVGAHEEHRGARSHKPFGGGPRPPSECAAGSQTAETRAAARVATS